MLLGVPDFGLSTAEVFGRFRRGLTPLGNDVSLPSLSAPKWPQGNDFESMVNDLEAVVFEGWPELRRFRDALLEAGASVALMSGSGSTVFGVFPGEQGLPEAVRLLGARFPRFRILRARAVEHGIQIRVGDEGDASR
jgi:4-diphosphocytidyl-2-C-methyl-D-erythritol kinase